MVELMASTTSEHRGWTIGVTSRSSDEEWSASIEAWPPANDRTHTTAMILPFSPEFDSRAEVVNVALAEARRQIDRVEGTPRE
jgi:hypothetical protein